MMHLSVYFARHSLIFFSFHEARKKPLVAGDIGPYGAHLHDGSEYTGNYVDEVSAEVGLPCKEENVDEVVTDVVLPSY